MKSEEERAAVARAYYLKNKEKLREKNKRWLAANPGKVAEYSRRFHAKHPERKSEYYRRHRAKRRDQIESNRLKRRYGITREQVEQMKIAQNNQCSICSKELVKSHIDHDHVTGKVRSILCPHCNGALGLLQESARIAFLAASYLQSHGKA